VAFAPHIPPRHGNHPRAEYFFVPTGELHHRQGIIHEISTTICSQNVAPQLLGRYVSCSICAPKSLLVLINITDDKDANAEDEQLAQQAQQNLRFNPASTSFRPGASSFQPQYQQPYQAQGYQQQQQYGQYGANYGYGGQYPQYGGYNQQYQQYGYNPAYPQQQQPQQQQQQQQQWAQNQPQPGLNAQPAAASQGAPAPSASQSSTAPAPAAAASKPKVLSISAGAVAPKVEKSGQTKILTIGSTAPAPSTTAKQNTTKAEPKAGAEAGAKVAAAKAIQKTGEPLPSTDSPNPTKPSSVASSGQTSVTQAETKPAAVEIDAVAKEQEADVDTELLDSIYGKVRYHAQVTFRLH
jgi:peptide chain release factor subunit 3